jgi:hypothetical protein
MTIRERNDLPGDAVRLNVIGRWWKDDSSGGAMTRGIVPQNQRDPGTLRAPGALDHPVDLGEVNEPGLHADPEPALRASVGSTNGTCAR